MRPVACAPSSFDGRVEFIFIDGRSEDATVDILRELAATDPRVRILENPRRSTPVALNIGLRAARGEFVARMDAHTHYPPAISLQASSACGAAAPST